jgi:hypothetical protein
MTKPLPWLLTLLLSAPAQAGFFSGADLLERLGDERRLMAMGYVAGVFDTGYLRLHCPPPTTSLTQATYLVEFALANGPADRARPAELLVLAALQAAWPCPQLQRQSPPGGARPPAVAPL